MEEVYTGTYQVVKMGKISKRRNILERGLTRNEAKAVVNRFPDSNRSIVFFEKQFFAKKWFIVPSVIQSFEVFKEAAYETTFTNVLTGIETKTIILYYGFDSKVNTHCKTLKEAWNNYRKHYKRYDQYISENSFLKKPINHEKER